MSRTVAFHSLGCKVNSYESEAMERSFVAHGFSVVPFTEIADIYVVNTCSVTGIADRKSRQMLHRARRMNPDALVVAVGCYVETDTDAVRADEKVDLAVGNVDKTRVVERVEEYLGQAKTEDLQGQSAPGLQNTALSPEQTLLRTEVYSQGLGLSSVSSTSQICPSDSSGSGDTNLSSSGSAGSPSSRTRAFVKIQDGCNLFCSYCIIPYARGRNRSRDAREITEEVRGLVAQGFREVVLTGIHISSYGLDAKPDKRTGAMSGPSIGTAAAPERPDIAPVPLSGSPLLDLLRRIHDIDGLDRIRLSSLEPRVVTEEFAHGIAALPKICPHFHLSLQSGDNATLMRMRRHYTVGEYRRSVALLRSVYDDPAITTDIICGFPGETGEQFQRTLAFAEEIGFYEIHVFPYSKRKGTAAASFEGQLTSAVKKERAAQLLALTAEQSKTYRARFLDKEIRVLWEDTERIGGRTYLIGNTERYVRIAKDVSALSADGISALSGTFEDGVAVSFLNDETLLMG